VCVVGRGVVGRHSEAEWMERWVEKRHFLRHPLKKRNGKKCPLYGEERKRGGPGKGLMPQTRPRPKGRQPQRNGLVSLQGIKKLAEFLRLLKTGARIVIERGEKECA